MWGGGCGREGCLWGCDLQESSFVRAGAMPDFICFLCCESSIRHIKSDVALVPVALRGPVLLRL